MPHVAGDEPVPGYALVERIGVGSFGEVWKAVGPGGKSLALKIVELSREADARELRSLLWLRNIGHAHLVHIAGFWIFDENGNAIDNLDSGADETPGTAVGDVRPKRLIVAMALCEKSLADRLKESLAEGMAGIPVEELLEYMNDAAKALDFLNSPVHRVDGQLVAVQHRDIKPDNILLLGGTAMIADIGVARLLQSQSITASATIGTLAYMAPENIEAQRTSRQSDQYSLSVTYYELRTGHLPFPGGAGHATVVKCHVMGTLDLSKLPAPERKVIAKATSLDPGQRYNSCRELVREIAAAVHQKKGGWLNRVFRSEPRNQQAPLRPVKNSPQPSTAKPTSTPASRIEATLVEKTETSPATKTEETSSAKSETAKVTRDVASDPTLASAKTTADANNEETIDRPEDVVTAAEGAESQAFSSVLKLMAIVLVMVTVGFIVYFDFFSSTPNIPGIRRTKRRNPIVEQIPHGVSHLNSLGMRMVWIPDGTFTMGSPSSEAGRTPNEDQVQVTIDNGFWMGEHEVTQSQWKKIMGTKPWETWSGDDEFLWPYSVVSGDRHPALMVTRHEARQFCRKLTERERKNDGLPFQYIYRLPTEAEWEYCCRAGSSSSYSFGNDLGRAQEYAWFTEKRSDGNTIRAPMKKNVPNHAQMIRAQAHEVGTKEPNAWSLYDMHGNVSEWCEDNYSVNLPGGVNPIVTKGFSYVYRGGSFDFFPPAGRSAARHSTAKYNYRRRDLGFRIVLSTNKLNGRLGGRRSTTPDRRKNSSPMRRKQTTPFDDLVPEAPPPSA